MTAADQAPILLAAYGGGHVNIIIPIYRRLQALDEKVVVLGLTMAQTTLRAAGIPFKTVLDFVDKSDQEAIAIGTELYAGMVPHDAVPYDETIAYMGLSYNELILDHGLEHAMYLYETKGRQAFLPRRFARKVLSSLAPKLLMTTNSPRMEKALILEASQAGVPTVVISDFFDRTEFEDRTARAGYGHRVFVPFQAAKDEIVSLGRSENEVAVTGNPGLDYLAGLANEDSRRALRRDRGWHNTRVILWIKSAMPSLQATEEAIEKMLVQSLVPLPDVEVVIRPHPNDPRSTARFRKLGFGVSEAVEPLIDVVLASDTICTINSTVGLQANLLGRAVVQANLVADFPEHVPFDRLGFGQTVTNLEELRTVLTDHRYFGLLPPCMPVGRATDLIVQQSLQLIDQAGRN